MLLLSATLLALSLSPAAHADDEKLVFTLDQVIERLAIDMPKECDFDAESANARKANAEQFTIHVRSQGNGDGPDRDYQVFQLPCTRGAYNFGSVFYVGNPWSGLALVQFAVPVLDAKDQITGWSTENTLINAGFEQKDNTVGFFSKGRGIADCFSSGTYKFVDGRFVLKTYDIDSACDGKVKPKHIVNLK